MVLSGPRSQRQSDITDRLDAPWIPAADIVAFTAKTIGADIRIDHMPELASWTVEAGARLQRRRNL